MSKLTVVGIGPGNYENMTVRADLALQKCDVIIGYHVYVNLVKGFFTPPYETAQSLKTKLESMYAQVKVETVESMGCFTCQKG